MCADCVIKYGRDDHGEVEASRLVVWGQSLWSQYCFLPFWRVYEAARDLYISSSKILKRNEIFFPLKQGNKERRHLLYEILFIYLYTFFFYTFYVHTAFAHTFTLSSRLMLSPTAMLFTDEVS